MSTEGPRPDAEPGPVDDEPAEDLAGPVHRRRFRASTVTVIAVLSALIALGAALTSVFQLRSTNAQNVADEQAELTTIVQNLVQLNGTAGAGVSVQSNLAQSTFLTGQMADAEQAAGLARQVGATPTEYYEIGSAFANQFDWSDARWSEQQAAATAQADSDPRMEADALREEALVYIAAGTRRDVATGRALLVRAVHVFDHTSFVSPAFVTYNRVYTDLFAAEALDVTSCSLAQRYWVATEQALASAAVRADPLIGDATTLEKEDGPSIEKCDFAGSAESLAFTGP